MESIINKTNELARKGDLVGLKYIFDNNKIIWFKNPMFKIACDNKHYHIMKYIATKHKYLYYSFGNAYGSNLFNHYCREHQIDIVIEIIKITIRIKRLIDFTSRETIIKNNGTYNQSIMHQLTTHKDTHKKIIYYLESCGASIIHKKLI